MQGVESSAIYSSVQKGSSSVDQPIVAQQVAAQHAAVQQAQQQQQQDYRVQRSQQVSSSQQVCAMGSFIAILIYHDFVSIMAFYVIECFYESLFVCA